MKVALIALFFLISPIGSAAKTERSEILKHYFASQKSLSEDKLMEAVALAKRSLPDLEALAKKLNAEGATKIVEGAKAFAATTDPKDARKSFGEYSSALVTWIGTQDDLKKVTQLFLCPMVPKGTYGYWVQPKGQSLVNPYYGSEMLTCGVKRPWPEK